MPQLPRGQQIEVQITSADELGLELEARYIGLIDTVIDAAEMAEESEATVNDSPQATLATEPSEGSNTDLFIPPPLA
jgi:hypothetical protein